MFFINTFATGYMLLSDIQIENARYSINYALVLIMHSLGYFSNSKTFASELLENLELMFLLY